LIIIQTEPCPEIEHKKHFLALSFITQETKILDPQTLIIESYFD